MKEKEYDPEAIKEETKILAMMASFDKNEALPKGARARATKLLKAYKGKLSKDEIEALNHVLSVASSHISTVGLTGEDYHKIWNH